MSAAKAFQDGKMRELNDKPWAGTLADEITRRQRRDGSWANELELVRENEPLVATSYAVSTLATCAQMQK
jgi:hypothetical protein